MAGTSWPTAPWTRSTTRRSTSPSWTAWTPSWRVRKGGVSVRMRGSISGQLNLISAAEIEFVEEKAIEDDPFATFAERAGEADDKAYASP